MALIKSVRGFTPEFGENCFLADNAAIIGDVKMGRDCSIWFSTVLRGDVNSIRIGNGVNIQDGSVLHTLYEKSTIEIGDHVSVGHNVTIHGATIKDYALVGMGSTILDHAVIGEGAIVAAGSLVLSNTVIAHMRPVTVCRLLCLVGFLVHQCQQLVHVDAVNHAGLFHGLTAGRGAAKAMHTDGQENRSRLGSDVQNITDNGVLRNIDHWNDPPHFKN